MELLVAFRDELRTLHLQGVDGKPSPGPADERADFVGVIGWLPGSTAWLWSRDRSGSDVVNEILATVTCDLVVWDESDREIVRREAGVVRRAA